jgi:hypothetical protein
MEHVNSFRKHSKFKIWKVNTEFGFPNNLDKLEFQIIIFHYSLFGTDSYRLDSRFEDYIRNAQKSYKIAFYQDEHHFCKRRFDFINQFRIDCVYTLLENNYFKDVYQKYTKVPKLVSNIPGYVSENLVVLAKRYGKVDDEREIDIGYRGRELSYYMGAGAQEKVVIAEELKKRACGSDLRLDVETNEYKRLYGNHWYRFIGNCKSMLGVEAGVSIFDVDDIVLEEYKNIIGNNPKIGFNDISKRLLNKWENNIYYRTISPRHFESAAFNTCQILFEGKYSGIMKPLIHYIPLKKDFSNYEDVIRIYKDQLFRKELTKNAYRDLIASGIYSYKNFINTFDAELKKLGFNPKSPEDGYKKVALLLSEGHRIRMLKAFSRMLRYYPFPGRNHVKKMLKTVIR